MANAPNLIRTGISRPRWIHSTTCSEAEGSPVVGSDGGKTHSSSAAPPTFPRTSGLAPPAAPEREKMTR
ncbi:hypothetical protein EYF80_043420 [Liparis tanakae]|uniref:Uncharacterized protein n=1 Tax=Liparis tanakae TaxID=230148 RepID=A0A4Z2FYV6_9TELE|nr:hypothetical protein EYF80_043420 [Liparis tanakae]